MYIFIYDFLHLNCCWTLRCWYQNMICTCFWYQKMLPISKISRDSHVLNKQCSDLMRNFQYKEQLSRQNLSRRMYALIAQRGSDHSVPLSKESKTFNDMSRGGIFWYQHCSVLSRDSHVLNKQCSDLMGNFQYKEQLSRQNLSRRMYALIAQRGSDHWSCPELKTFNDMSVTWRFRQKRPDFRFLSCTDMCMCI